MQVLLTEDNALIASGIVAGLQAQGFGVAHAATAAQADALLRTARFDLMILDLGLPDEDGLHFLRRLRRRGLELPVLVLTARDAVALSWACRGRPRWRARSDPRSPAAPGRG